MCLKNDYNVYGCVYIITPAHCEQVCWSILLVWPYYQPGGKQKCCSSPTLHNRPPPIHQSSSRNRNEDWRNLSTSVVSFDGSLDKEINTKICKTSQALGGLALQSTKLIYKKVVLTSFLYGSESWILYGRHITL